MEILEFFLYWFFNETKVTYKTCLQIYNHNQIKGKEVKDMKIVSLCGGYSCCPVVKVSDDYVEIGEDGNLCILTKSEWEILKNKIMNGEV